MNNPKSKLISYSLFTILVALVFVLSKCNQGGNEQTGSNEEIQVGEQEEKSTENVTEIPSDEYTDQHPEEAENLPVNEVAETQPEKQPEKQSVTTTTGKTKSKEENPPDEHTGSQTGLKNENHQVKQQDNQTGNSGEQQHVEQSSNQPDTQTDNKPNERETNQSNVQTNNKPEQTVQPSKGWTVPIAAKKLKNPTNKQDKENLAIGKSLYAKHCKSCHGKTGKGDGPKAGELDTPCGDFTTVEFQSQTDGELFYKTTEGRDDMPSFKKKIPDGEDRWLIVNYIRTFIK